MAKPNPKATAKKAGPKSAAKAVKVKDSRDVVRSFNVLVEQNLHNRLGVKFSKTSQQKLVAYGPWLMVVLLVFVAPELMLFAKTNHLVGLTGFLERILFDQQSWVLLIIIFTNCLLLADGLSSVAAQKKRGWDRVYLALLINSGYILWQLGSNLAQPAAPLVSLLGLGFCLFTLLDIKRYYK